jgi:prohibitin 2
VSYLDSAIIWNLCSNCCRKNNRQIERYGSSPASHHTHRFSIVHNQDREIMAQKFRDAFQKMAQNIPKGAGGGGGGEPGRGAGAAKAASRAAGSLIVAGGLGYGAYNSIFTVEGGHRAVMFNRILGMKPQVYNEGLNFNIPWFERPIVYDIRTRPVNLQTLTGSKDLQMVTIGVRVLHKPDQNNLVWIYRHLGMNYDERILPSLMNECAKAVVARYNANELLTKREEVSAAISAELSTRCSGFHVLLEDVAITHLAFSPEYAKAVEAKQVAQQDAERAKYVVLGAIQEKKTIITKARGEAESAELIGNAVKRNPGFMKLRRIDAAKDIADIVAGSGNKVYLNADSLLLNLLGDADDKFEKSVHGQKRGWLGK